MLSVSFSCLRRRTELYRRTDYFLYGGFYFGNNEEKQLALSKILQFDITRILLRGMESFSIVVLRTFECLMPCVGRDVKYWKEKC